MSSVLRSVVVTIYYYRWRSRATAMLPRVIRYKREISKKKRVKPRLIIYIVYSTDDDTSMVNEYI